MRPTLSKEDTLPHVQYSGDVIQADDPNLLRNKVSATDGSIVIVSAFGCSLVLNWAIGASDLHADLTLQTPVGSVTLANADITPQNPTITVGGSIDSFKAEATISFDFSTYVLTASGEVCAPFVGCKSGSVSIHI